MWVWFRFPSNQLIDKGFLDFKLAYCNFKLCAATYYAVLGAVLYP